MAHAEREGPSERLQTSSNDASNGPTLATKDHRGCAITCSQCQHVWPLRAGCLAALMHRVGINNVSKMMLRRRTMSTLSSCLHFLQFPCDMCDNLNGMRLSDISAHALLKSATKVLQSLAHTKKDSRVALARELGLVSEPHFTASRSAACLKAGVKQNTFTIRCALLTHPTELVATAWHIS